MEVEIRARINNPTLIRKKLNTLGCQFVKKKVLADYYFGSLELFNKLKRSFLIRVRATDDAIILCYKQATDNDGVYEEHEQELQDINTALTILTKMGLDEIITIKKVRETYKLDDVTIVIDQIKGRGNFIELEKISDNTNKDSLILLLQKIGVDKDSIIQKGYITLFLEEDKSVFSRWITG